MIDFPSPQARVSPEVKGTAALAQGSPSPGFASPAVPEEALARFLKQTDEAAAARFQQFNEKLSALADQTCSRIQAQRDTQLEREDPNRKSSKLAGRRRR